MISNTNVCPYHHMFTILFLKHLIKHLYVSITVRLKYRNIFRHLTNNLWISSYCRSSHSSISHPKVELKRIIWFYNHRTNSFNHDMLWHLFTNTYRLLINSWIPISLFSMLLMDHYLLERLCWFVITNLSLIRA